jgi:hypothetical protein
MRCWEGGWQLINVSPGTAECGRKRETGRCHGKLTRSVLARVRGVFFALLQAVDAKLRSTACNSQFGLLGSVLRATTTAVKMASPVRNILDTIPCTWAHLLLHIKYPIFCSDFNHIWFSRHISITPIQTYRRIWTETWRQTAGRYLWRTQDPLPRAIQSSVEKLIYCSL